MTREKTPNTERGARFFAAALFAFALACPSVARADAETDRKLAAVLYQDAKDLIAKGDYAAACPKLEESYRLDRSATGTLMNLAVCHERTHKYATAWAEFGEVVARSRLDHRDDRLDYAQKRADELLALLSQLVLDVPAAARVPGLVVRLDGAEIAAVLWGTAMKIDAGRHVVSAEAPGRTPWRQEVDIGERANQTVGVPPLAEAPVAATPPAAHENESRAAAPEPSDGSASRRSLGVASAAFGAGALVAGGVFGVLAISANARADDACETTSGGTCATSGGAARARELSHQATVDANIANVAIGVGIVAAAAGVYLLLTAPRATAAAPAPKASAGRFVFGSTF